MNSTDETRARDYAAALRRELGALPDEQSRLIVEGVEEHIADALAEGRPIDDVLAGLGEPREAAAAHAEALGVTAGPDPSRYARRVLGVAGAAVAVPMAAIAPLVYFPTPSTTALDVAAVIAVLVLPIPMLLAPAFLRRRAASILAWVSAAILLAIPVAWFCGAFDDSAVGSIAWLLFPTALVAWAAAIVPPATRWSPGRRRALRIAGGVLAGLPGILPLMAALSGTVASGWAITGYTALGLGLGVLVAWGRRIVYLVLAGLGLGVVVFGFGGGLLVMAFLLVGGLWVAVGASGLAVRPWRR